MNQRLTQAQKWLAAGYRYEDVDLWQELCEFLEEHGLVLTANLPSRLAPLVFRDPENTYLVWLRDNYLVPVAHLTGRSREGGNGWRVRLDWREHLDVMRHPEPTRLLAWWRELEPVLRRTCLKRAENAKVMVYDTTAPGIPFRDVSISHWYCSLCKHDSLTDDPRGISHKWRERNPRAKCPLLRLHQQICEAEHNARPDLPRHPLESLLIGLAEQYIHISDEHSERFWKTLSETHWRTTSESVGHSAVASAANHIAQICGVWIEPTSESLYEYARFLRGAGYWPHSEGESSYCQRIEDMYMEAANHLDALGSQAGQGEIGRSDAGNLI